MVAYQDLNRGEGSTFTRLFSSAVDAHELVWHRDRAARTVRVMSGEGWKLQMDNSLPEPLVINTSYEIPARVYHRILPGVTDLTLEITEHQS